MTAARTDRLMMGVKLRPITKITVAGDAPSATSASKATMISGTAMNASMILPRTESTKPPK